MWRHHSIVVIMCIWSWHVSSQNWRHAAIAGTPRAVAQSSLGFGAFSYVIDRMGQQPANAAAATVCCDADGTCRRQLQQVCTSHAHRNHPSIKAVHLVVSQQLLDWWNFATFPYMRFMHKNAFLLCTLHIPWLVHCAVSTCRLVAFKLWECTV